MKRVLLGSAVALVLAPIVISCGSDAEGPKGGAGAPQAMGGSASGMGGSMGMTAGSGVAGTMTAAGMTQGGSPVVAGASSGGSTAGTGQAGAPPTAGSTGSAGKGGSTGSGGASGGSAGSSGGSVATGGAAAGTGGASAGTGGGDTGDLVTTVAKSWDGALVQFPCGTTGGGYDCANTGCAGNMVTKTTMWTLGGQPSTVYSVTFNVRGIVEAYAYNGGTRDAANASITQNPDLFLRGGKALTGGDGYDYNTFELGVTPPVTGEPNVYFLNSVTNAENPHSSSATLHLTFPINYTKTIKVMGGGTVSLKVFDSNCTLVQNCGPTSGNNCTNPRTVPLTGVTPAPPSTFMQPYQMPSGKYGQWVFFDITNVVAAP